MPAVPSYLTRSRHGLWYFRIRIPELLRPFFGENRREIRRSLHTGNLREAHRRAQQFATSLQLLMAQGDFILSDKNLTNEQVLAKLRRELGDQLPTELKADYIINGNKLNIEFESHENDIAQGMIRDFLDTVGEEPTSQGAFIQQSQQQGIVPTALILPSSAAEIDSEIAVGKIDSKFVYTGREKFSELIIRHCNDMAELKVSNNPDESPSLADPLRAKWTIGTRLDAEKMLFRWLELIGDIPFASITLPMLEQAKAGFIMLPPNSKKGGKGKIPVQTLIQQQKEREKAYFSALVALPKDRHHEIKREDFLKTISAKTFNNYVGFLSGMYDWAKDRVPGVSANLAEKLSENAPKTNFGIRDTFTEDELRLIFESDTYKKRQYRNAAQYFAIHILLFTGMRLNEICQLHVSDVVEVEHPTISAPFGVLLIDEAPVVGQTTKTANSIRRVPVNSQLWGELGLRDYWLKMKGLGQKRLFPTLKPDGRGKYHDSVGDWFNRLLKRIGIKQKGLDCHSFRHTVLDFFKQTDVPERFAAAIAGHGYRLSPEERESDKKTGNQITYDVYGKHYQPHILLPYVQMLGWSIQLTPFSLPERLLLPTS